MRAILLSIMVLALTACQGNIKPNQQTKYVQTSEMPGMSKEALFQKAEEWFATGYKSSTHVIKMKNPETGTIIGRAVSDVDIGMGQLEPCYYLVKVEVKDGKIRFTTDDYFWVDGGMPIKFQSQLDSMLTNMKGLSRDFIAFSNKTASNDDW